MMCLNVQKSISEAFEVVALPDLPFFVLDETGFINCTSSFKYSAELHYVSTTYYKFPVVLMHDLCEDG